MRCWIALTAIAALITLGCDKPKVNTPPPPSPAPISDMTGTPITPVPAIDPAPTPAPVVTPAPTPTATGGRTYTIKAKEGLMEIARKELGDPKRVKEILAMNPEITDANKVKIGQVIKLPEK